MLNQSFRQVMVTNIPALLPSGKTVESLAVGQVAILDGKSHLSTTTPTYGKNKAIKLVWGTPDGEISTINFGGPIQNEYSKLIKGKLLRNFRGKAAARGQHQILTVGFSGGVSDDDTLFAKPGELKELFLTLTGGAIDKEFSTQGIQRRFFFKQDIVDDCVDTCVNVDCRGIAETMVKQINADKNINRYVRASVITECDPAVAAPASVNSYKFTLTVPDTQDNIALGKVQAQYPDYDVKRIGTDGISSVYEATRPVSTLPAAFTQTNFLIPECDVCPAGFTEVPDGFAYSAIVEDAGDAGAQTAAATDYGIAGTESITRVARQGGSSTYILVSSTELDTVANPELEFLGETRTGCVLTTPTSTAWTAGDTLIKVAKAFRITLADDICGDDRLADVQAAYPNHVVTLVDAGGDCVHTYEITVYSQEIETGCSTDVAVFDRPEKFEGAMWQEVPAAPLADGTTCKCGIKLEVAVVNRQTNECTFEDFYHDSEAVFLEVSTGDQNYNSAVPLENEWVVKQIQQVRFPRGEGAYIQKLEKDSLSYALKQRSSHAIVRQLEGYSFQAQAGQFYDEYVLEFDFSYLVGGWSERYTDAYSLFVYFPEGQGKEFEAAINSYILSTNQGIDPVVL